MVGKGPDAEPPIDLDTMLDLTAAAEVDGVKFDGVDLFLFAPHVDIDATDDDLKRLAEKVQARNLVDRYGGRAGLAAHRRRVGDGRAPEERERFLDQVRKGCRIARRFARTGRSALRHRPDRLGRATRRPGPRTRRQHRSRIAETFREACDDRRGPRRAAGRRRRDLLGRHAQLEEDGRAAGAGRPARRLGFQADMAHTLLYLLGYNAPEDAHPPGGLRLGRPSELDAAYATLTDALRPWTIDFHVAQNDATVKGSGSHDKTGRHCLANDPTASSTSPSQPATGCATRTAS